MAVVTVLVASIALLADWFWWSGRLGGFHSRSRDGGGHAQLIFYGVGTRLMETRPKHAPSASQFIVLLHLWTLPSRSCLW